MNRKNRKSSTDHFVKVCMNDDSTPFDVPSISCGKYESYHPETSLAVSSWYKLKTKNCNECILNRFHVWYTIGKDLGMNYQIKTL